MTQAISFSSTISDEHRQLNIDSAILNIIDKSNEIRGLLGGNDMRAKVDRDVCIGCELCTTICPKVFQMDDEQVSTVIADPVPADVEDEAKDAAESCPAGAITIEE